MLALCSILVNSLRRLDLAIATCLLFVLCVFSTVDPCYPNPCFNGGQCQQEPDLTGFQCQCTYGWLGTMCITGMS